MCWGYEGHCCVLQRTHILLCIPTEVHLPWVQLAWYGLQTHLKHWYTHWLVYCWCIWYLFECHCKCVECLLGCCTTCTVLCLYQLCTNHAPTIAPYYFVCLLYNYYTGSIYHKTTYVAQDNDCSGLYLVDRQYHVPNTHCCAPLQWCTYPECS